MSRKGQREDMEASLLAAFRQNDELAPGEGSVLLMCTPGDLAENLKSYGEDRAASQVSRLSRKRLGLVFKRAGELNLHHGASECRALAVAAIEVIEGKPRELARKRRIGSKRAI